MKGVGGDAGLVVTDAGNGPTPFLVGNLRAAPNVLNR
jgi:hypothetical protein